MKELIVSYWKNVLIVEIGPSKLKLWLIELEHLSETCAQHAISRPHILLMGLKVIWRMK